MKKYLYLKSSFLLFLLINLNVCAQELIKNNEDSFLLKQAIQDSIKKEEFKSFSTNDLRLFELHGHVKSVSNYTPLDDGQIFEGDNGSDVFFFNKDGECQKRSDIFKEIIYDK